MKKEPPSLQRLIDSTLKLYEKERLIKEMNTMHYKLIEALKAIDYKDLAVRALWTFVQAFLAVFIVAGESIIDLLFNGDWSGLWTLFIATVVSATAAGLSALKTIIVSIIRDLKVQHE